MNWKHVCAAAALAVAAGAQPAAAQMTEAVAAIVNDQVISTYDVNQRAQLLIVSAGMQSTPQLMERARAQALRDLIDEHLQLQEASGERFHITVTDAQVDRRLQEIAQSNNTTVADFTQQLARAGVNISTLRAQIKAGLAWSRLMSGLYSTRVRISEREVADTQARIAASATSTHYLVSEIFLPAENEQEFTQAQNGAMRLLEQMQHGAPFPAVARQFSGAPSAASGGDIGWLAASELQPELSQVVQQLQPGQVSLPIRTSTGIYIVALREKHDGQPAGSTTRVTLREVTAPVARRGGLDRFQRRTNNNCANLERDVGGIQGAQVVDLGATSEADLSPAIRDRIANVAVGASSAVEVTADQASIIVVCARDTGGAGVPNSQEIENRLYQQEMGMLSERYLRNLRREATIITR